MVDNHADFSSGTNVIIWVIKLSVKGGYELKNKAFAALRARKWVEAKQLFNSVIEIEPNYIPGWRSLAEAEYALNEYDLSLKHYLGYCKLSSEPPMYVIEKMASCLINLASQHDCNLTTKEAINSFIVEYIPLVPLRLLSRISALTVLCKGMLNDSALKALANSLNQDIFQATGVALKLLATYKSRYRAKSVVFVGTESIVLSSCSATKLIVERIDETTIQWRHELNKKPHILLLMQDTILTVIPNWEANTTNFIAMYSSGRSAYDIHVNGCRTLASINRNKDMCTVIVSDCYFTHSRAYVFSPSGVANEIDLNPFQVSWQYVCPFSSEDWIAGSGNELYIISANGKIDQFWQTQKVSRQVPPGWQLVGRENKAFQTLGIDPTDNKSAIKDAYKRQVRRWHPDVNDDPGATRIMQHINEAYEMLISKPDALPFISELSSLSITGSFPDYYDYIYSLCSSAKDNRLVVITGSFKMYHWRSRQLIKTHQFKKDTSVLAVLEDGSILLWDGNFIRFQENGTMVTIPRATLGKTFISHPNACLTQDESLLWVYSQDQRRVMIFDPRQSVFLGSAVFPTPVRAIQHATTDDSVLVVSDCVYHIRLQPRNSVGRVGDTH